MRPSPDFDILWKHLDLLLWLCPSFLPGRLPFLQPATRIKSHSLQAAFSRGCSPGSSSPHASAFSSRCASYLGDAFTPATTCPCLTGGLKSSISQTDLTLFSPLKTSAELLFLWVVGVTQSAMWGPWVSLHLTPTLSSPYVHVTRQCQLCCLSTTQGTAIYIPTASLYVQNICSFYWFLFQFKKQSTHVKEH